MELVERRTRTSKTFRNQDGTFTKSLSSGSIHYRDEVGKWQPIRSEFVSESRAGFAFRNRANRYRAQFRRALGEGFLRFETDEVAFSLTLVGAQLRPGAAVGSRLDYAGVLPGVDLRYELAADALKETLVLGGPTAPTEYRFLLRPLEGAGLEARKRPDGSWAFFRAPRLQPVFVLEAPFAVDAAGAAEARTPSRNAALEIRKVGEVFALDLTVDGAWLLDPARKFPVLLDPTVTIGENDTQTSAFSPTCPGCFKPYGDRALIGTDQNVWRTNFSFDLREVPPGAAVTAATFMLYFDGFCLATGGPACGGTSHTIDLHKRTGGPNDAFAPTPLASFTLPAGAPHQWMSWNVTPTVVSWLSGAETDWGLLAKRDTEPLNASGPAPPGYFTTEPTLMPRLDITYGGDGVQLRPIETVHSNGAELEWTRYTGTAPFGGYEIHRDYSEFSFTPNASTLLTTISDPSMTTFRDTTAAPGARLLYRVVVNGSASNMVVVAQSPADGKASKVLPASGKATTIARFDGQTNCANYGAETSLLVGPTSTGLQRALVAFDLRDIPAGALVTSAKLQLWRPQGADRDTTLAAHRLTEAWEEGSGAGTSCTGDGATWYETQAGVSWAAAGASFEATAAATTSFSGAPVDTGANWDTFDLTALAGKWVRGEAPNHGVVIKASDEAPAAVNPVKYWSDEFSVASTLQPRLTVEYEDGSQAIKPTVSLNAPGTGAVYTPGSTVTLRAEAADDRRVEQVEFFLGSTSVGVDTTAPYSVTWTAACSSTCPQTRQFTAQARDDMGQRTTSIPIDVAISNPPEKPAISYPLPPAPPPPPYNQAVTADAPSGYWRLNEPLGSLTAADSSGAGVTGTYVGPELAAPGVIAYDKSVSFDGVDDHIGFGNRFGFTNRAAFTVEAWVKPSVLDTVPRRIAAKEGNDSAGVQGWDLRVSSSGFALARIRTDACQFFCGSPPPPPTTTEQEATYLPAGFATGKWYHVVGSYDGSNLKLYADGELRKTVASTLSLKTTTAAFFLGRRTAGDYFSGQLDEAAIYSTALSGTDVREHYQAGPPLAGTIMVSGSEVYADGVLVGTDSTAPYEVPWNTLDPSRPSYDGTVTLTSKARNQYGQTTWSDPVNVTIENGYGTRFKAGLTSTELPRSLLYDPAAQAQQQHAVDVTVTNRSPITWTTADTSLRYSWRNADTAAVVSTGPAIGLGGDLAPNGSRTVVVQVEPPVLPAGASRARFRLRVDLVDTAGGAEFASKGNRPIEGLATVVKPLAGTLGVERYYRYEGEPLGAGMETLTNVATGNLLWRWTPFSAPGRGLGTSVGLSYNSHEDRSDSPAGNSVSLAISSLTRLGQPLEIHPTAADQAAGRDERYIELTDGDGTRHRFEGATAGDGSVYWQEPAGVRLYLRQYSTTDATRKWALSRPDRVTFFYDADGYPTSVEDRNGNRLSFTLATVPAGEQLGGVAKRVAEVTDAGGRTFTLAYWSADEVRAPQVAGRIKRIADHNGSGLRFDYYDDGNLLRLTQEGGVKADGSPLADRSIVFTYTTAAGDGPAVTDANARANPDAATVQSSRLYSVRDPRGAETSFGYVTSGSDRWKLASRTNRAGKLTSVSYDNANRLTTVTAPLSRVTKYGYDAEHKVTTVTDPLDRQTLLAWDGDRNLTKVTEPTGKFVEFAYNDNGFLTDSWDQLRNRTSFQLENIAVDANDVAGKWELGRSIPHLSQIVKRTNPKGTATANPSTDFQWSFAYDTRGNLTSVRDPFANETFFALNPDGTVSTVTDANQHTTRFNAYDQNGLATEVVDAAGGITRFGYDDDGLLRWVQDPVHASYTGGKPEEYRTTFDYDSFHRLGRTSTPKSTEVARGILIWTGSEFDSNDNPVTEIGAHYGGGYTGTGARTTATYDAMDRPDLLTSPTGARTQTRYDEAGRPDRLTTPKGMETTASDQDFAVFYDYDLLDRTVKESRYEVTGAARILRTHLCYSNAGDLVSTTAPNADLASVDCASQTTPYTSRFTYDDAHRIVAQTDAAGNRQSLTYDANGNVASSTNELGVTSTRSYDERDLLIKAVEPFDTTRTPVRELTTRYEYDLVGNLKRLISPRAWDASADKQTFTQYVTSYTYDPLNRVVKETLPTSTAYPQQHYVHRAYDSNSNLSWASLPVAQADPTLVPADQKTVLGYFDPGWIRTSKDPANPTVHFAYTPEGRQAERVPETSAGELDLANRMLWTYRADGLLAELKDEGGQGTTYSYDANGNLAAATEGTGLAAAGETALSITASYDGFDQLTKSRHKKQADGSYTATTYSYDLNGNLAERYDDRVEDAQGALSGGRRQTFGYDARNLPIEQLDYGFEAGSADDLRIISGFSATGNELERAVQVPNGGSGWQTQQTTTWAFFANEKLRTLQTQSGSGEVIQSRALAYEDPGGLYLGHRTRDTFTLKGPDGGAPCQSSACTAAFTYDPRERLVLEEDGHGGSTSFTLDPAGNVTREVVTGSPASTRDFTYVGNQLRTLTSGSELQRYFYDSEGNLDCVTAAAGSQTDCAAPEGSSVSVSLLADYGYDYLNRVASVRTFAAGVEQSEMTSIYDVLDRPVRELERQGAGGSPRTLLLSYLGLSSEVAGEEQRSSAGSLLARKSYSHDLLGNRIMLASTPAGQATERLTYGYDAHGSVSLLLGANGQARARYGYRAYGAADTGLTNGDTGADPLNRYRYSGKRQSGSTLDMGARRFLPDVGRFLQLDLFHGAWQNRSLGADPINQNRYSLAAGNPISYIESDGHLVYANGYGGARIKARAEEPAEQPSPPAGPTASSGGTGDRSRAVPEAEGGRPLPEVNLPSMSPASETQDRTLQSSPSRSTGADKRWCASNPLKCPFVATALTAAYSAMWQLQDLGWLGYETDGSADAFRHAFWIGLIALRFGADTAREVGLNHEAVDPADDLRGPIHAKQSRSMDLHNNSIGISIALSLSGGAAGRSPLIGLHRRLLVEVAREAVRKDGRLWILGRKPGYRLELIGGRPVVP